MTTDLWIAFGIMVGIALLGGAAATFAFAYAKRGGGAKIEQPQTPTPPVADKPRTETLADVLQGGSNQPVWHR